VRRGTLAAAGLLATGLIADCGGGGSPYYGNGYRFAQTGSVQAEIDQSVLGGQSPLATCSGLHSRVFDAQAFLPGTAPGDSGPTQADNNAWAQGCAAGYKAAS
jgi:hypothetical protein